MEHGQEVVDEHEGGPSNTSFMKYVLFVYNLVLKPHGVLGEVAKGCENHVCVTTWEKQWAQNYSG
jgi:hypothetical protein